MLIDFRTLFPQYSIHPSGVLHIGANVGEEAAVYNELGIKKVFWFEANPNLMGPLLVNTAVYPGQKAFNYCLGDEDKDSVLHISSNGGQSSSVLELGTHKIAHPDVTYIEDIPVRMRRLDSIGLDFSGLDFLNIDVQGFELNVLRGMGDLFDQFKWVYLEVNETELYRGCALLSDIDLFMTAHRMRRVETKILPGLAWGDALFVK